MKLKQVLLAFLIISIAACKSDDKQVSGTEDLIVRIAEVVVDSSDVDAYIKILKEEAAESLRLEPGVISIFPMNTKNEPNKIRILEVYQNEMAYKQHLTTKHFLKYKSDTLAMVKSLELIDLEILDNALVPAIFRKMKLRK